MASERPRRQSRAQRKSYNHDPLKEHIFESGSNSEGAAASGEEEVEVEQDSASEVDDFAPAEDEEEEVDESVDEEADGDGGSQAASVEDVDGVAESAMEINSDADAGMLASPKAQRKKPQSKKAVAQLGTTKPGHGKAKTRVFSTGQGSKIRQRVIEEWNKGGQEQRLKTFFGPTVEDMYPVLQTRDHWLKQEALPSRSEGSLRRSFFVSDDAREKEIKITRDWYAEVGREAFAQGEKSKEITETEGRSYMRIEAPYSMDLLIGDFRQPKMYTLKQGEYMKASAPFQNKSPRRGWIFNLGTRIQELQWTPNENGRTQYLAVAVEQKRDEKPKHKPLENPKAPAFTAIKPFPASIQIWAFESAKNGDMDPDKPPRLEHVICTDWGAPKFFRWCPIAAKDTPETGPEGDHIHLGLLSGVWSDGILRLLNVTFRRPTDAHKPTFVHHSASAFEISIPDTIPTCLHWLSGTSLAVATASGNLAIWSLNRSGTLTNNRHPKPWFYKHVADTYILSLSSGYPSRPHMVSITTADGFARLFDLRSPSLDASFAARGRSLVQNQAWHEQTQSFVMADEFYLLKHSSMRRFHGNIYSVRMDSILTCCATSPVHPCILVGGADGAVEASNTLPKVLNSKDIPWQQTWFKHEWRPPLSDLILRSSSASGAAGPPLPIGVLAPRPEAPSRSDAPASDVLSKPLTRITEGYKARQLGIAINDESKRYREGAKLVTIFDEKTAVTRLAWNPNLRFGTWAAAGTNSGYLRVEDLGVM